MRNYGGPREPALEDSRQAKPVTGSESDTKEPVADDGGGEEADYRVQTKIHRLIYRTTSRLEHGMQRCYLARSRESPRAFAFRTHAHVLYVCARVGYAHAHID